MIYHNTIQLYCGGNPRSRIISEKWQHNPPALFSQIESNSSNTKIELNAFVVPTSEEHRSQEFELKNIGWKLDEQQIKMCNAKQHAGLGDTEMKRNGKHQVVPCQQWKLLQHWMKVEFSSKISSTLIIYQNCRLIANSKVH